MDSVDMMLERRRMTRKMRFWRGVCLGIFLLALVGIGLAASQKGELHFHSPTIVRLHIDGMIIDDPALSKKIHTLADEENVKAVILDINSPGGTTAGSEALYEDVRRLAVKKPVVAVMHELAASGGYVTAVAADYIVARGNTITGSIGVIMSAPNFADVLQKIGVSVDEIKSAPAKGEPTGFHPISPEGRQNLEAMVKDSYDWFYGLVKDRRHLKDDQMKILAQGQVYTGRQAKTLGLIDEIGDERVAMTWLKSKNISEKWDIEDVRKDKEHGALLDVVTGTAISSLFRGFYEKIGFYTAPRVDGLTSIWQP